MATKPEFSPGQDMSDVTPKDVQDAKRRAKESAAYDKALTTTVPAPKPSEKKYAKGGYVKSADGCAKRGKTRGKMV